MAKMESVWKKSSDAGNYDQVRPDYPRQVVDVSMNYLRLRTMMEKNCQENTP